VGGRERDRETERERDKKRESERERERERDVIHGHTSLLTNLPCVCVGEEKSNTLQHTATHCNTSRIERAKLARSEA